MRYFSILRPMQNNVRFEYIPWKNIWLCFISIDWIQFSHNMSNFSFENHWNTLIFFDQKRYVVRFEYVSWKNVWFCFISIVWVHFSHKIEKFRFWRLLKYFNVFLIKNDVRFDYIQSNNVWFGLSFVVLVKFWQ